MIVGNLKSQVDQIWDSFATGGISNPLTVIEQFTYLLFIRRLDERQLLEEKKSSLVGIPSTKTIFTEDQKIRMARLRFENLKRENDNGESVLISVTMNTSDRDSSFEVVKSAVIKGVENVYGVGFYDA